MSQRIPGIYVASSSISGRGVFCATDIPEGSLIEICPVLRLTATDVERIKATTIYDYYFEWGENFDEGGLAMGFGSIYNHSVESNARYLADYDQDELKVIAIKNIPAGEEITFNYNGDPEEKGKVWFEEKTEDPT